MIVDLDVRGLACPLPVLKARKRLKSMQAGDTLVVQATDPSAEKDFEAFAELTGNTLVSSSSQDGVYTFVLERT